MKLTKRAIEGLDRDVILELAKALGFSEVWIKKIVEHNKNNGPLTTAKALQTISQTTGLTQDEILEEDKSVA